MDSNSEAGILVLGVILLVLFTRNLLGCDSKKAAVQNATTSSAVEKMDSSLSFNLNQAEVDGEARYDAVD